MLSPSSPQPVLEVNRARPPSRGRSPHHSGQGEERRHLHQDHRLLQTHPRSLPRRPHMRRGHGRPVQDREPRLLPLPTPQNHRVRPRHPQVFHAPNPDTRQRHGLPKRRKSHTPRRIPGTRRHRRTQSHIPQRRLRLVHKTPPNIQKNPRTIKN